MLRRYALALVTLVLIALPQPTAAQPPSDFSGVWALDSARSDTLPAPRSESARRGVRIAVRAGSPYGRFPDPFARSIHDPERLREALDAIGPRPTRLFVSVSDTVVMISRDGAAPFAVWTDGREEEKQLRYGLRAEIEARWDDGRLRIERTLESGLEIVETYWLESPDRLVVRIEARGPVPRPIDVRWRYDRSDSLPPSSPAASKSST